MLTAKQHSQFPVGLEFLRLQESVSDLATQTTDEMLLSSGEKLPASSEGLGTVLSMMYRAACCAWGCTGGNHQLEWLVGRVVNQANASFTLVRHASYDESLMLSRGIGEIANLLWLFQQDDSALNAWQLADRRERLNTFGPAAVRKRLAKQLQGMGPPIDDSRYQCLCEVGTHPVPSLAPSHFTGSGRPILSGLVQPVGVYVSITELAYSVAMCAIPVAKIVLKNQEASQSLLDSSIHLLRSLGAFTILNYEDLLTQGLHGSRSQ